MLGTGLWQVCVCGGVGGCVCGCVPEGKQWLMGQGVCLCQGHRVGDGKGLMEQEAQISLCLSLCMLSSCTHNLVDVAKIGIPIRLTQDTLCVCVCVCGV